MSLPLKDFRPAINQRTHAYLARIARARGVSLQDLGRQIIEAYVDSAIHDAKVLLGMEADNAEQLELIGNDTDDAGIARKLKK